MKISVAMTSYNGEKYIEKQLESLRLQSYKPDEVIIFDDKSQDSTTDIITEYIHRWDLNNWKLYLNKDNNGWIKNFYKAINQATGDIVFFCDQDDIWKPEKISLMLNALSQPDIEVLACRLSLMDQNDDSIDDDPKRFPFNSRNTGKVRKNHFSYNFLYTISPGCTLAVKREIISKLGDVGERYLIPHDALYWKMATLCGTAYIIDLPLIKYRIHENNTSTPIVNSTYKVKKIDRRIKEAESVLDTIDAISSITEDLNIIQHKKQIIVLKKFCNRRVMFLKGEIRGFGFLVRFYPYYNSKKMIIGDILSKYQGGKK